MVSLLLANGHADARFYPIGWVYVEGEIVSKRLNIEEANRALLTQMAISSQLSKKGRSAFKKRIEKMLGNE